MKRIAIAACFLLMPMTIMAAQNAPAKPPSQAAINACIGKAVGDAVKLPLKNGQVVSAKCKEVNGQLVAVRKKRHHNWRKKGPPAPR